MGAANPRAGARRAFVDIARALRLADLRIAAVTGDDVLEAVTEGDCVVEETGGRVAELGDRLVSANAYIGAEPIVEALAGGADMVITGRAADPSLFLAPLATSSGGRRTTGRGSAGARSSAICSSAPGR